MANPTSKTPAKVRQLHGRGPGKDIAGRKIDPPPPFKRQPPEPPVHLSEFARSVWDETAPELTRLDLTKAEDRYALANYCQVVEQNRAAYLEYLERGLTSFNASGTEIIAPWVVAMDKTSRELRNWAVQFGLTPAAESNLKAKEAAGGDEDLFADQQHSATG